DRQALGGHGGQLRLAGRDSRLRAAAAVAATAATGRAVGAGAFDRLAVGHRVDRVDDRLVLADPAVDVVGLAVAGVDDVVAERDLAREVRAVGGRRVAEDRVLAGA